MAREAVLAESRGERGEFIGLRNGGENGDDQCRLRAARGASRVNADVPLSAHVHRTKNQGEERRGDPRVRVLSTAAECFEVEIERALGLLRLPNEESVLRLERRPLFPRELGEGDFALIGGPRPDAQPQTRGAPTLFEYAIDRPAVSTPLNDPGGANACACPALGQSADEERLATDRHRREQERLARTLHDPLPV